MIIKVFDDKQSLAKAAAAQAAMAIRGAIAAHGRTRVVAASAASQIEFLAALTAMPGIDWKKIELFHLDEYIGLPMDHPASFSRYMREHLISKTGITNTHLLNGAADPLEVIREVDKAIGEAPIDIAFVGIGENGHLAFNDPPANFETKEPFLIVDLDEACRRQQVGEGYFKSIDDVPKRAVSMSVQQVLSSREIIAVVPDSRKAQAVKACFDGPVNPMAPASILRTHPNTTIYLDKQSAGLLNPATLSKLAAAS